MGDMEMTTFAKIKSVKCPHCQERFMSLTALDHNERKVWRCSKCVYSYQPEWFDNFFQFSQFVTRWGDIDKIIVEGEENG